MANCGHQRIKETKREIRAALKKIRTMPQSGMGICGFQNDGDSESGKTLENSKQHVVFQIFKWMDVLSEWKNHFWQDKDVVHPIELTIHK